MTQPFGGYKQSGNARDKCFDSFKSYTQSKSAWFRLQGRLSVAEPLVRYGAPRRGRAADAQPAGQAERDQRAGDRGAGRVRSTRPKQTTACARSWSPAPAAHSPPASISTSASAKARPDPADVRRALENDFRIIMRFWDSPEADHRGRARLLPRQRDGARRSPATSRSRRRTAAFGAPEVKFGSGIVAMLLPWLAGPKRAKYLLLTGEDRVTAARGAGTWASSTAWCRRQRLLDEALALAAAHRSQRPHGRAR